MGGRVVDVGSGGGGGGEGGGDGGAAAVVVGIVVVVAVVVILVVVDVKGTLAVRLSHEIVVHVKRFFRYATVKCPQRTRVDVKNNLIEFVLQRFF